MRIKSFSYESDDWVLQKLDLQEVNLLVGQNGTGKSKTLANLNYFNLIEYFLGTMPGHQFLDDIMKWEIEWTTKTDVILEYKIIIKVIDYSRFEIIEEKLLRNSIILLQRKRDGECQIYSENTHRVETFTPPHDKLAILSRRDTKSFPYIEEIINWSKNSRKLSFNDISQEFNGTYDFNPESEPFPLIFSKLKEQERQNVINNFQKIGFSISEIRYLFNGNHHYLLLKEKGVKIDMYFEDLSQGMLRTLNLLIYVEYLISKNETATLLIDDLGEGLDYIRATGLGKILFKLCEENNIQLIATTNDNFLMDVIDIDNWNVLIRDGKTVTGINKVNHPKLFEDFVYEGTSNFNFFSSSYLPSRL